ncbi:MAG TPA: DUF2795 domain-containing protein [Actinomycetales bacterium]|nr:DUF2795 domain-containing protein [Actinomycetales bacterium]
MSRQSGGSRGQGQDERLKHETQGGVRAGRSTRAEEWREPEPAGEDQPTGDRMITPDDLRSAPVGMTPEDVEARAEIARYLGIHAFPGDRRTLVQTARENQATDAVLAALESLPADQQFKNVQEVARAMGMGTEEHRT